MHVRDRHAGLRQLHRVRLSRRRGSRLRHHALGRLLRVPHGSASTATSSATATIAARVGTATVATVAVEAPVLALRLGLQRVHTKALGTVVSTPDVTVLPRLSTCAYLHPCSPAPRAVSP
jgi:hypothetical protein